MWCYNHEQLPPKRYQPMKIDVIVDGMILESTESNVDFAIKGIKSAENIGLIIKRLESLDTNKSKARDEAIEAYQRVKTGKETRKQLNKQAKEILARIGGDASKLTAEDRIVLMQYSGEGGTGENAEKEVATANALFEFYTPKDIAHGTWEMLKANGFESGAVCEPSAGAGVFIGTKPSGVKVVGCEIDETSSSIAAILNPDDVVRNQSFEELCTDTPNDSFDSFIGNVPFGNNRGSYAFKDAEYQDIKQIQRYFVTRAVDKVKPAGLVCLIVPTDIVSNKSKGYAKWRAELSLKAEFLGAHRLPSSTFGGAGGQGTSTVTDVILLQKHSKEVADKVANLAQTDLLAANVVWPTWTNGEWFKSPDGMRYIHGTEEIVGTTRKNLVVKSNLTNSQVRAKMAARFDSRIDFGKLNAAKTIIRNYQDGDRRVIAGIEHELIAGSWVKTDAGIMDDGSIDSAKYGVSSTQELERILFGCSSALAISYEQASFATNGEFSDFASRRVKDAVALASSVAPEWRERVYRAALVGGEIEQYTIELNNNQEPTLALHEIQSLITDEVTRFGSPSDLAKLHLTGSGASRVAQFNKSILPDGGFSDLLAGAVERQVASAYDSDDATDIVRYLVAKTGRAVDLVDVQALYTGQQSIATLNEITNIEMLAVTPTGQVTTMRRYVSGDVAKKAKELHYAISMRGNSPALKNKFKKQLEAIEEARNRANAEQITFSMRGKWIPEQYLKEFIREQGFDIAKYGGEWDVESAEKLDKQLGNYLNGKGIGGGAKAREYREQVAQIEQDFNNWMRQHDDIDDLVDHYNDTFNGYLPHEFDESDLGLTGLSGAIKPHGYQNAGIRRLSEEGRGILAYDVGLGKTFTALSLAAYNAQMGRAHRTCIVVPKAVLENWYHEARALYGNMDHVLTVGFTVVRDKDGVVQRQPVLDEKGQPRKNKNTGEIEYRDVVSADSSAVVFDKMHQIPTTAASLVIMTKEKFGEIPMMPETIDSYASKMVDSNLLSETRTEQFQKSSYKIAQKVQKLSGTYSDTGTEKKNSLPYFESMGFDSVIVDEAHEFKNAYEARSTARLAYLPNAPASARSIDMASKMDYLRKRNNGRGPVLLSATPITNSPTEIFNMLSYLVDIEEFSAMGINNVDDFINHFCEVKSVDVTKLSGKTTNKDAVVGFHNLDGLRSLFHRFTNMKKASDVNDENNSLKIPDSTEINVEVEMTSEQNSIYHELRMQADGYEKIDGQWLQVKKEDRRPIFSIIRDMDRVTSDLDLYNRTMTFTFPANSLEKVNKLVKDLPASLANSGYVVDVNTGQPRKMTRQEMLDDELEVDNVTLASAYELDATSTGITMVVPEQYESEVVSRLAKFGIEQKTVAHPVTPKYAKLLENLRKEYNSGGKQIVFTEEKTQHDKIKRLITHHLPIEAAEIEIINAQTAGDDKLEQITSSYNSGVVRIVIANRKAEVGVNLQRGTTAIHHLTLPWTPASIQQRNGRGVRQGNTASNVDVFYYAGKGSFDNYRLEMLKRKADWLDSIFTSKDSRMDNADAGDAEEYGALLAANPEEYKRRRAEQIARREQKERDNRNRRAANELVRIQKRNKLIAKITTETPNDIEARAKLEKENERASNELLKQQRDGKIDYDVEGMLNGAEYAIDMKGRCVMVGKTYEMANGGIFRVTKIENSKLVYGELLVNDKFFSPYELSSKLARGMTLSDKALTEVHEVNLNESQLNVRKIIKAGTIDAISILNGTIKINQEDLDLLRGLVWFRNFIILANGERYDFERVSYPEDKEKDHVILPNKNDKTYVDAVGEIALSMVLKGTQHSISELAEAIFGSNWQDVVMQKYGKSASKQDIERVASEALNNLLDVRGAHDLNDGATVIKALTSFGMKLKLEEYVDRFSFTNAEDIKILAFSKAETLLKEKQDEIDAINKSKIAAVASLDQDSFNKSMSAMYNSWDIKPKTLLAFQQGRHQDLEEFTRFKNVMSESFAMAMADYSQKIPSSKKGKSEFFFESKSDFRSSVFSVLRSNPLSRSIIEDSFMSVSNQIEKALKYDLFYGIVDSTKLRSLVNDDDYEKVEIEIYDYLLDSYGNWEQFSRSFSSFMELFYKRHYPKDNKKFENFSRSKKTKTAFFDAILATISEGFHRENKASFIAISYPPKINTDELRALYDVLDRNETLTMSIDEVIKQNAGVDWVNRTNGVSKVRLAIKRAVNRDEDKVDAVLGIALKYYAEQQGVEKGHQPTINTKELQAIYDALSATDYSDEKKVQTALDIDKAMKEHAPVHWIGDESRERQVKNALFKVLLRDRDLTLRVFDAIKEKSLY